ncbi:hypothetical protein D9611_012100 [Ephemerocybe angulata]|uniref:Uncharacterized protein n=1 Tax=Ephemerocybe angulata TaxID=980116 RepID=A0A8H5ES33_9AGAR|nr:hypothetical protein D9611_012100 [Tulosesus angulatus]
MAGDGLDDHVERVWYGLAENRQTDPESEDRTDQPPTTTKYRAVIAGRPPTCDNDDSVTCAFGNAFSDASRTGIGEAGRDDEERHTMQPSRTSATTIEARVRAGECDGRTPPPTYDDDRTVSTRQNRQLRRRTSGFDGVERGGNGARVPSAHEAYKGWTCRRRREHAQHAKDGHHHRPATTTSISRRSAATLRCDRGCDGTARLEKPPHSVSSLRISKRIPAFRRRRIPAIDVDVVVADKTTWTWVSCSKCLALKVKSVTSMGKKEI